MKYLIETPRLRLREMEETDAPFMHYLNSDPEVLRFIGDAPYDPAAALDIVRYVRAQYAEYGIGRWLIEFSATGQTLGWCGLKMLNDAGEVDLGYRFPRHFWGLGFGFEAAEACVRYGFEHLRLKRLTARAMPENLGSMRILEKSSLLAR